MGVKAIEMLDKARPESLGALISNRFSQAFGMNTSSKPSVPPSILEA